MARVAEHRNLREAAAELNHVLPERVVSVFYFLACGETSVDNSKFAYAGTVESLKCSNPKVQVRIHGILNQYRNVSIGKGIGDFLHEERIGTGSCTQPDKVHTVLDALEHVLLARHLSGNFHPVFLLHPLKPLQSRHTNAFKASRMGPRFPYSCTEHIDTELFKPCGGLHYLVFAFSAARSSDYAGTRRKGKHSPFIQGDDVEFVGHRYNYFNLFVLYVIAAYWRCVIAGLFGNLFPVGAGYDVTAISALCGWPEI